MNIDPKSKICGHPATITRDALRRMAQETVTITRFIRMLHYNKKLKKAIPEPALFLSELAKAGYIEANQEKNGEIYYELNTNGYQLANASALKRFTRKQANKEFNSLIERALEIEGSRYYLDRVSRITVFGSFITDSETVSDIDICIEFERKTELLNGENYHQVQKVLVEIDEQLGQGFRPKTFSETISYSVTKAKKFLKNRRPILSFHFIGEIEESDYPRYVLYEKKDNTITYHFSQPFNNFSIGASNPKN
jgi:predicted nucleotidyltransferase